MKWTKRLSVVTGQFLLADGWERPRPAWSARDIALPIGGFLLMALNMELMRSYVSHFRGGSSVWWQYLVYVVAAVLLGTRRRWPVISGVAGGILLYVAATWVPEAYYGFIYQIVTFFLLYSMVSWGRNRFAVMVAVDTMFIALMLWLVWLFALGNTLQAYSRNTSGADGIFPPIVAGVLVTLLSNLFYYLGSVYLGQSAWREARDTDRIVQQSALINDQAEQLAEQAVLSERLRLARELHDVVAHHVSLMGVQAAGARRVLTKDPELAAEALGHVEQSSREAVTQMRHLLGTLRGPREPHPDEVDRSPEPSLDQLDRLVAESTTPGFTVTHRMVGDPADLAAVPQPVQLSLFRVVQEALTNVRRHSTAKAASVVVRVVPGERGWAEVEVLDDGRPRSGTSGSGLGQLGMRERVNSHGGSAEIGPRATGGYRVRVRFPLVSDTERSLTGRVGALTPDAAS